VEEAWAWSERVAVVSEPGQDLAGVREARFESLQRVDGSVERPSQSGRELLRAAGFLDAGEQRLDGAVIGGAVHVEVVDRAASGVAGGIGVSARGDREIDALVGGRMAGACSRFFGWPAQRAISAAAAKSWNVAQGGVA
jgi:hypothetical protein